MAAGSESVPLGDADSEKPREIPGALTLGHPGAQSGAAVENYGSKCRCRQDCRLDDMDAGDFEENRKPSDPPTFVTIKII